MKEAEHIENAPPSGTPRGRFVRAKELQSCAIGIGVEVRPLVADTLMVSFGELQPNGEAPVHAHEEMQLIIVLDGEPEVEVDGVVHRLGPGDLVVAPPWTPHGVRAGSGSCRTLDIFTPPRLALLDMLTEAAE